MQIAGRNRGEEHCSWSSTSSTDFRPVTSSHSLSPCPRFSIQTMRPWTHQCLPLKSTCNVFTTTLKGRYCYYPQFTERKTEGQRKVSCQRPRKQKWPRTSVKTSSLSFSASVTYRTNTGVLFLWLWESSPYPSPLPHSTANKAQSERTLLLSPFSKEFLYWVE